MEAFDDQLFLHQRRQKSSFAKTLAVSLCDKDVGYNYVTAANNNGKYFIPKLPDFPVIDSSAHVASLCIFILQMAARASPHCKLPLPFAMRLVMFLSS